MVANARRLGVKMKTGWLRKTTGWRVLIAAAPLVALLGVSARAATITFNPGNGDITGIQNINFLPASVDAQGGVSSPSGFNIFYQSQLNSASSATGQLAGAGPGGDFNGSGNAFTVVAGFREAITSTPGNTVNFTVISTPGFRTGTADPNFFEIFRATPGSANFTTGTGFFQASTPILTGFVLPPSGGFGTGSFSVSGSPVRFNQSGSPSPLDATTPSTNPGNGTTQLVAQVVSADPTFFPGLNPSLTQLTFNTANSLPFFAVTPTNRFSDGTGSGNVTANPGPLNQVTGPDIVFQSTAVTGFTVVPEPSSIIPALTAATMIPPFLYLRWRRSRTTVA